MVANESKSLAKCENEILYVVNDALLKDPLVNILSVAGAELLDVYVVEQVFVFERVDCLERPLAFGTVWRKCWGVRPDGERRPNESSV